MKILSILSITSGILFAIAAMYMKDGEIKTSKTTKVNIIAAILFATISISSGLALWSIE